MGIIAGPAVWQPGLQKRAPRVTTDLLSVLQVIQSFILLHVIKVVAVKAAQEETSSSEHPLIEAKRARGVSGSMWGLDNT